MMSTQSRSRRGSPHRPCKRSNKLFAWTIGTGTWRLPLLDGQVFHGLAIQPVRLAIFICQTVPFRFSFDDLPSHVAEHHGDPGGTVIGRRIFKQATEGKIKSVWLELTWMATYLEKDCQYRLCGQSRGHRS